MIRGKQAVLWEVRKGESASPSARASMGRVEDEELEDEEERDPKHAISASYTTHETDARKAEKPDARKAEKPTNNTLSKSAA
jgi:hypothetical protein